MSELIRTPETIASEINIIKAQTRAMLCSSAVEIGRRLYEAKMLVPHGGWGEWLKQNVDYSERTAQNLIRLFEEYGKNANPQALADLDYTQAVILLGLPPEQREELMERVEVRDLSTRELQEEVSRLREENEKRQVTIDQLLSREETLNAESAKALLDLENERAAARSLREERDKAVGDADRYRQQAEDSVESAGKAREEIKRLKDELKAERSKPEPLPETEYIERVPEEVQAELDRLRRQAQTAPNEAIILLRNAYRELIDRFSGLEGMLREMAQTQPEEADRYRCAIRKAAEQMAARLAN